MSRALTHIAGITLIVGALLYSSFITEAFLGFPLDPAKSYLSELSARDQPFSALVRSMDGAAGTLFVVGGVLLLLAKGIRLVAFGLLIAGAFTVADSLSPMDCAEVDPICSALVQAGQTSLSHSLHSVTSSLAGLGIAVIAVGCIMTRRRLLAGLGWAVLLSFGAQLAYLAMGWPIGIVQRIQVGLTVAMFILIAIRLLRRI